MNDVGTDQSYFPCVRMVRFQSDDLTTMSAKGEAVNDRMLS